jgi:hypothetical protein
MITSFSSLGVRHTMEKYLMRPFYMRFVVRIPLSSMELAFSVILGKLERRTS